MLQGQGEKPQGSLKHVPQKPLHNTHIMLKVFRHKRRAAKIAQIAGINKNGMCELLEIQQQIFNPSFSMPGFEKPWNNAFPMLGSSLRDKRESGASLLFPAQPTHLAALEARSPSETCGQLLSCIPRGPAETAGHPLPLSPKLPGQPLAKPSATTTYNHLRCHTGSLHGEETQLSTSILWK